MVVLYVVRTARVKEREIEILAVFNLQISIINDIKHSWPRDFLIEKYGGVCYLCSSIRNSTNNENQFMATQQNKVIYSIQQQNTELKKRFSAIKNGIKLWMSTAIIFAFCRLTFQKNCVFFSNVFKGQRCMGLSIDSICHARVYCKEQINYQQQFNWMIY